MIGGLACLAAAALVGAVWTDATSGLVPAAFAQEAPAEPDAAELAALDPAGLAARVTQLRTRLEQIWAAAEADHALVRSDAFAARLEEDAIAAWVTGSITALRGGEETGPAGRGPAKARPLLSAETMSVLWPRLSSAAREDRAVAPADVFLASARALFEAEAFEDVWDAVFVEHADVRAFREANAALAAMKQESGEEADPVSEPPLETMVFFDRASSHAGPWIGMVEEIAPGENVRQKTRIKGFYVDRHEVTCGQYLAFLLEQPERKRAELLPGNWTMGAADVPQMPEDAARCPVTHVGFAQAAAYAKSVGKRLPNEDEWDHVARGEAEAPRMFVWGDELDGRKFAYRSDAVQGPMPVDQFPQDATPEGVAGMAGNVAEMVATLPNRKHLVRGLPKEGESVVTRGGSFRAPAEECVAAWRWFTDATTGDRHVGFRCVMDVNEYKRGIRAGK